jgi:hypothetical protein
MVAIAELLVTCDSGLKAEVGKMTPSTFYPLDLGEGGMGCRDKYVTS